MGTIGPLARKHGQAVPPGGGPGGAAGISNAWVGQDFEGGGLWLETTSSKI